MSCCGQRRAAWSGALPERPASPPLPGAQPGRTAVRLMFEYVGSGAAFTVESPRSGRRYRFERTGARLEIDPRDRPMLAALPQLRQVG